MPDSRKLLFVGIMLAALLLILAGTGAGPLLAQWVVTIAQAVGSFVWGLIPKAK